MREANVTKSSGEAEMTNLRQLEQYEHRSAMSGEDIWDRARTTTDGVSRERRSWRDIKDNSPRPLPVLLLSRVSPDQRLGHSRVVNLQLRDT